MTEPSPTTRATTRPIPWEMHRGDGPVIATAVHSGHAMRDELHDRLALDAAGRRREEDPLTDLWVGAGDDRFRARLSRFEVDLNRPEGEAVYLEPSDAWGLHVWRERPGDDMVARSLAIRERFYALMAERIEAKIAEHGRVLVLDVHSYNHRRDAPDVPADVDANPLIDLGLTTADHGRFGAPIEALWRELESHFMAGEPLDVRENVRFVDGGHFPEWVFAAYGADVCTITLEVKKAFMDEWTGTADLGAVEELRIAIEAATQAARAAL